MLLVVGGAIGYVGVWSQCPACKKWFSARQTDYQLIQKQRIYREETAWHRDPATGNRIETVRQVPMVQLICRWSRRCRRCGHEWHERRTQTTQA